MNKGREDEIRKNEEVEKGIKEERKWRMIELITYRSQFLSDLR